MTTISFPELQSPSIFLGGNTAKGDWQKIVEERLEEIQTFYLINTSRADWVDKPSKEEVSSHIDWEMNSLCGSEIIFINIPAGTESPTVLLEAGIAIASYHSIICVHPDYKYYDHILAACKFANVKLYNDFDLAVQDLLDCVKSFGNCF